jgi:hypothetical protein
LEQPEVSAKDERFESLHDGIKNDGLPSFRIDESRKGKGKEKQEGKKRFRNWHGAFVEWF